MATSGKKPDNRAARRGGAPSNTDKGAGGHTDGQKGDKDTLPTPGDELTRKGTQATGREQRFTQPRDPRPPDEEEELQM